MCICIAFYLLSSLRSRHADGIRQTDTAIENDRVIFPAYADMDLAAILEDNPSLSRFSALLRAHGFLPFSSSSRSSSSWSRPNSSTVTGDNLNDAADGRGGGAGGDGEVGSRGWHNDERNSTKLEGQQKTFTTVFAPTNDALKLLEEQRPWLFQNATEAASTAATTAAAAVGGNTRGSGSGSGGGRMGRGDGDDGEWSPIRELLAYHLVPDAALFSRYPTQGPLVRGVFGIAGVLVG